MASASIAQLFVQMDQLLEHGPSALRIASALALLLVLPGALRRAYAFLGAVMNFLTRPAVPVLDVSLTDEERDTSGAGEPIWEEGRPYPEDRVPCYDPATMRMHCPAYMPVMGAKEVHEVVERARVAQKQWEKSSWEQRRHFIRIVKRFILDHNEEICRVASRDSGKTLLDAAFGEIMVTLEKADWLLAEGEATLLPDHRSAGKMMFYKTVRVEYHPVGVAAAIVPWNYPFHNVFNPVLAHVFAGNALVIKVSEHASWSSRYYGRVISAALAAAGAPTDLVQIVTGYAECGSALVSSNVGHVTFVGSTNVGKKVMAQASKTLTPVTLELGGKDAVVILDDARLDEVVDISLRAAFQSCGQNCAGGERFIVQQAIYESFLEKVAAVAKGMRQGAPLDTPYRGLAGVDSGAMCMPGEVARIHFLVQDARNKGARVMAGGFLPEKGQGANGQFYPPTVVADVTLDMRIAQEEVFGPVLAVFRATDDDDAVRIANSCPFGLGSNVFGSPARARAVGERFEAGMANYNDFASSYMAQSLPFGGVKDSGFGRFAGVEGLRACCVPKAVSEDRANWLIRTTIPPPLRYPVAPAAVPLTRALCRLFYGLGVQDFMRSLVEIAQAFLFPPRPQSDGISNGHSNGHSNGQSNGKSNGHSSGHKKD